MKKMQLLLVISLFTFTMFSQEQQQLPATASVDQRIVEVFGDQLQQLVLNDALRLRDLNAILFERYEITEVPYSNDEKYTKLSEVPLFNFYNPGLVRDTAFDRDTFNILKYDMRFFAKSDIIYRVDNTNYIIVIHPQNLRN
ncbi:MAG TPA: hypothetical protein VF676_07665 [Flavobacterium sp.]|jgi:hypothetical protein